MTLAPAACVEAQVKNGTQRDAVLFSVGANADHGLRRTNEDKRRAVLTLLKDAEWGKKSLRFIAEDCAVSHDLVNRIQKEQLDDSSSSTHRVGKDGKTRKVLEANRAEAAQGPAHRRAARARSRCLRCSAMSPTRRACTTTGR